MSKLKASEVAVRATEDAIQRALQSTCTTGQCQAEGTDAPASAGRRRIGGVIAGFAVATLTAAIAVTLRRRRPAEETAP